MFYLFKKIFLTLLKMHKRKNGYLDSFQYSTLKTISSEKKITVKDKNKNVETKHTKCVRNFYFVNLFCLYIGDNGVFWYHAKTGVINEQADLS